MATSSVEARSGGDGAPDGAPLTPQLSALLADLQSRGLRIEERVEARRSAGSVGPALEARRGGAGPADAGMLWVEGVAVTVPVAAPFVAGSPYLLRAEDEDEYAIYRDGERVASARRTTRPRYYDLTTEDGIPYWQIALLHLDSVASTVIQTCMYWDTADVCQFCGIELSLRAGRTIPVKRPEHLAEVAVAARDLDGAVDATLTTGTTHGHDKGATYIGRCAQAIKHASGLPVEVQFEPPDDLEVLDQVHEMGADSVGMHVESFDPEVLARIAPAKARTGIEGYFRALEHAVEVFGRGQVSTYVILGMGEDVDQTVAGCRRAIDLGVYPFVVPLRPVPGTPLGDVLPPDPEYMESVYRRVVPYLVARGLGSWNVRAGCARCQACSAMTAMERSLGHDGRPSLPLVEVR